MSFIQSIQSKLPRPDNRSRPEIDRDLEDEFAFHLEMRTRAIEAEEGVDREAARGRAHARFGNIDRIRNDCQRIALKERIMLQRVNLVLMIVVMIVVVAVGAQVYITQRYNTLALQAITADLAKMKFEASAATRDSAGGEGGANAAAESARVLVEGDIPDVGWHAIDMSKGTTIADLLRSLKVRDDQWVTYRRNGAQGNPTPQLVGDYLTDAGSMVLRPNDELRIQNTVSIGERRSFLLSQWRKSSEPALLWIADAADGRPWLLRIPLDRGGRMGTLVRKDDRQVWRLSFSTDGVLISAQDSFTANNRNADWDMRDGCLVLNFDNLRDDPRRNAPAESSLPPSLLPPMPASSGEIVFQKTTDASAFLEQERLSIRASEVGRFVVEVFALANPNDPNFRQNLDKFLDQREASLAKDYEDDPQTAGMIRELIAARRKAFEADERAAQAATAEAKLAAVNDFLTQTLVAANPAPAQPVTASEVLDQAAIQVERLYSRGDSMEKDRVLEAIDRARKQAAGETVPPPPLDPQSMQPVVAHLMVASIPDSDPAHLPTVDQLDFWEAETKRIYRGDLKTRDKILGMIATTRTRLAELAATGTSQPATTAGSDIPGVDRSLEVSPFTAVRWKDEWTPIVNYAGQWFELRSVDGFHVNQLVSEIRARHGEALTRQRFSEDLLQMLEEISRGQPRHKNLRLQLVDLKSGSLIAVNQAPVSAENRAAIIKLNTSGGDNGDEYPKWPME